MNKKKYNFFRPQIRSRHLTHTILRKELQLLPFRSVVRFGSVTELYDTVSNGGKRIELNTIESIKNTSNKIKMKELFVENEIITSKFYTILTYDEDQFLYHLKEKNEIVFCKDIQYPIIAKTKYHSRGRNIHKINNFKEYQSFIKTNSPIFHFEQFYSGTIEYRLHVSPLLEEPIFSVRKLRYLKEDNTFGWIFNNKEGCFIENFIKPPNWQEIIQESQKAVKCLGLDIGTVDVKSNKKGTNFTIIEVNSAPGMGLKTLSAFKEAIVKILKIKYELCVD